MIANSLLLVAFALMTSTNFFTWAIAFRFDRFDENQIGYDAAWFSLVFPWIFCRL